jgi:DNA replication protein DnaC
MGKDKITDQTPINPAEAHLRAQLEFLGLAFMRDNYDMLANLAAQSGLCHMDYLAALVDGEAGLRRQRSIKRRIKFARFPVVKTLEQFRWSWPSSINRAAVQNLFRLKFIDDKTNVIMLGGVGLGKTHLATALGYAACLEGRSVLFTTAVDAINTLSAAQAAHRLKAELKRYLAPSLLCLDELGFLPIDKRGADLLFQIISLRYEQGSMVITSNRAYKDWPGIFNNDSTLASAILDRLLHHADTIVIEGKSYRMKGEMES